MARTSMRVAAPSTPPPWPRWSRKRLGSFDLGITFDGDADRVLFSDAEGRVVNGDAVLLLAARDMKARGTLRV